MYIYIYIYVLLSAIIVVSSDPHRGSHIFWHLIIRRKIWNFIWHLFWHFQLHFIWHSIWPSKWHSFWHLIMAHSLSEIPFGALCDIYVAICVAFYVAFYPLHLCGILSDVSYRILSGVLYAIQFGILALYLWDARRSELLESSFTWQGNNPTLTIVCLFFGNPTFCWSTSWSLQLCLLLLIFKVIGSDHTLNAYSKITVDVNSRLMNPGWLAGGTSQ